MRMLVALGGNAMTGPGGEASPAAQRAAIELAMERVGDLIAAGHELVITHGNGPQVGNLLVKNEIAASTVPPVPLDWCGAQTQATLGLLIMNALDRVLAERGVSRPVAALVTRTLVDGDDPGFGHPTKPIGRFRPEAEARRMIEHGQHWENRGQKGWRRVVASPQPLQVLEAPIVETLLRQGHVVVAAGGGGVPVVRRDGELAGIEAVLDKDLTAALLGLTIGAEVLVIATDVAHAAIGFGTPQERQLDQVTPAELRGYAEQGHFASGSMGPKVEAAIRFVEGGGGRAVITSLDRITDAAQGKAGTVVAGRTAVVAN
jgi:carbamate kinase